MMHHESPSLLSTASSFVSETWERLGIEIATDPLSLGWLAAKGFVLLLLASWSPEPCVRPRPATWCGPWRCSA